MLQKRRVAPWPERLYAKIKKGDGCWEWIGGLDTAGYGQLMLAGHKSAKSHRLVWIHAYGEIPPGLQVLHKCDNRKCCRADHLFLGTNADNMNDKVRKGRQQKVFSDELIEEVRHLRQALGYSQTQISKKFNISQSWISRIVNGKARASRCF
jgi:hypothetical protein